jgi:UMF1 family MFS transporter
VLLTLLAFIATTPAIFWVAAVVAGLCMGTSQSAGRALAGLFAPAERLAEFFGLWAFAVRLSAIVGPITYGVVTWLADGNHRVGILATGVFFIIGIVILRGVDVARGKAAATGSAPAAR